MNDYVSPVYTMDQLADEKEKLRDRIKELENENALLKHDCDASEGALRMLGAALEVESWTAVLEMEAKINTMKKALEQATKYMVIDAGTIFIVDSRNEISFGLATVSQFSELAEVLRGRE